MLGEIVSALNFLRQVLADRAKEKQAKPREGEATPRKPYKVELGLRLEAVRRVVGVSQAVMSDLLGLAEVSELERYEAGEAEMLGPLLEKIADEFFVRLEFLRAAEGSVFGQVGPQDYAVLMEQGFTPMLLSNQETDRGEVWRIAFFRYTEKPVYTDKYVRFVTSFEECRFVRGTGGGGILENLIFAMMRAGRDWSDLLMRRVSASAREDIVWGLYYCTNPLILSYVSADEEHAFYEWYREIERHNPSLKPKQRG